MSKWTSLSIFPSFKLIINCVIGNIDPTVYEMVLGNWFEVSDRCNPTVNHSLWVCKQMMTSGFEVEENDGQFEKQFG